jgi:hypothetical protein
MSAQDTALVKLSAARTALAECRTVMGAKQIAAAAEAARVYLERTHASAATVNEATEIRLLAEKQMGEFLAVSPKHPPGPETQKEIPAARVGISPPTLAEIGITYKESASAQKLAAIPTPEFHARIEAIKEAGEKLSTAKVLQSRKRRPAPSPRMLSTATAVDLMQFEVDLREALEPFTSGARERQRAEVVRVLRKVIEELEEKSWNPNLRVIPTTA